MRPGDALSEALSYVSLVYGPSMDAGLREEWCAAYDAVRALQLQFRALGGPGGEEAPPPGR